jgi:hypothetical protein
MVFFSEELARVRQRVFQPIMSVHVAAQNFAGVKICQVQRRAGFAARFSATVEKVRNESEFTVRCDQAQDGIT